MDTVVFRIHNPDKYPICLKAIQRLKDLKGTMLVQDTPEMHGVTSFHKAFFNKGKDSFQFMAYRSKLHLPSSSGGVMLSYDQSRKFISIECSLPKFYFGNNVCEIIPPMVSKYYKAGKTNMAELNAKFWRVVMKMSVRRIVRELTENLERPVDYCDVQLARWDICFNQVFANMADAKHYLDSIGRVSAPRIQEGNSTMKYLNGNVTFQTENYYFKVYHKGTEFTKTGKPQIIKTFEELNGRVVFDREGKAYTKGRIISEGNNLELSLNNLDKLQTYADKILRYELEATSKLMSYEFNTKLLKWRAGAYQRLNNIVFYIMREENQAIIYNLTTTYRTWADGKANATKPKFSMYTTEYYLPLRVIKPKLDENEDGDIRTLVEHPKTIKRIEKLLRCMSALRTKYLITDKPMLKFVYKFLVAEKSKERMFFLDTPVVRNDFEQDGKQYYNYLPVVDAENAILKDSIPVGVHYDGPVMSLLEAAPVEQRLSLNNMVCCISKHQKLMKALQFELLPEVKNIELLCKQYNQNIDQKIGIKGSKKEQKMHVNQMKTLFMAFKHDTWDDLRRSGNVSRQTLYNWKKKCEKLLGFAKTTNYISNIDLSGVARSPSTLYSSHYTRMLFDDDVLSLFLQNTPQLFLI